MVKSFGVALLLSVGVVVSAVSTVTWPGGSPTEPYPHRLELDEQGRYYIYWKHDETRITFEVHARTTGWVGFGLSPNGGMRGSDVVIGWVAADGTAFLDDRHAIGNEMPLMDESQDYELLHAEEKDGFTVLKFTRLLELCDEHDITITDSTMRLMFSWGSADPTDAETVSGHGTHDRGSRSVMLLEPDSQKDIDLDEFASMPHFDIRTNKARLLAKRTTYFCRIVKLPELTKKHHIVRVEPLIEQQNVQVVHHIVLYFCHGHLQEEEYGRVCWEGNMPDNATVCDTIAYGWAVGQETFYFPKETGMPIGGPESPGFLHLEMHYDNPDYLEGIEDSSGLRITYTDKLRQHDTGVMILGHTISWPPLSVPPHAKHFRVDSFCSHSCTDMLPTDLNAFAIFPHTHLTGRQVWTRQIRDGVELPEFSRDDNYDFNYQAMRTMKNTVVKPGDEFITSCVYNTEKRSNMTFGGPETVDEMCLQFFFYYPRTYMQSCLSTTQGYYPIHQMVMRKAMLGEIHIKKDLDDDKNTYDYLEKLKWDEAEVEEFQAMIDDSHGFLQSCTAEKKGFGVFNGGIQTFEKKLKPEVPLVKKSKCITRDPPGDTDSAPSLQAAGPLTLLLVWAGVLCR